MKKLNKVIFIVILLLTVVLPLSARKAMTVTWQWALSDSAVTLYRYQMNGEKDSDWTVVDGSTSTYTAIGLDPYLDYTLYLQASYDGVNWSESALCIAYAVLSVDDVPVVEESVVLPYEGNLIAEEPEHQVEKVEAVAEETTPVVEDTVEETTPVVEDTVEETTPVVEDTVEETTPVVEDTVEETIPVVEDTVEETIPVVKDTVEETTLAVEDTPEEAEKETEPSIVRTVFYVYGYGIRNEWSDDYFKSEIIEDGVVSTDDVLGFIEYEEGKYPDLFKTVDYALIDNGFALTFEKGLYDGSWIIGQYSADLAEYIEGLSASIQDETPSVQSGDFTVYGYTIHNTLEGAVFTSVLDDEYKDIVWVEDILAFINYETEKYPALIDYVSVTTVEKGTLVLSVPSTIDFTSSLTEYKKEIEEFISWFLTKLEKSEEPVIVDEAFAEEETVESAVEPAVNEEAVKTPDALAEEETVESAVEPAVNEEAVKTSDALAEEETVESAVEPAVNEEAVKTSDALAEEETVESAVEPAVDEEAVKTPDALGSITAKLIDSNYGTDLKATFNIGFNIGAEWGFVDGFVTCFPRSAITLEGQNLLKVGRFGFGIRSDISSLLIPSSWIENGYEADLTNLFSSSKWGVDATVDMKLMTYYNLDRATFYLGVGAGYTVAREGYTSTHSLQKLFDDNYNSAVVITGVVGLDLRMGRCAYITLEGYSRAFLFNDVKSATLGASIGINFKL